MSSPGRVKCVEWEGRCQAGDLLHRLVFVPTSICIPTLSVLGSQGALVLLPQHFFYEKVSLGTPAPLQDYLLHLYHRTHWSLKEDRKSNSL